MDDHIIEFKPTDSDVVSTKLRTWNLKHPGNLFYTELVQKMVPSISGEDINEFRRVADGIVRTITLDRGGRFLKLRDGDLKATHCTIMNHKQCVAKVAHALRTAYSRQENRIGGTIENQQSAKKKKKTNLAKASNVASKARDAISPRPRGRRSISGDTIMYRAEASKQQTLPKYMLDVISIVCNQYDSETAHRVLDKPIGGRTHQTESNQERLMRLNIRQRFASAASIGMSPYEFATKLLKLWGGKLVTKTKTQTKIVPSSSCKGRSPMPHLQSPATPPVGTSIVEKNDAETKEISPQQQSSATTEKKPQRPLVNSGQGSTQISKMQTEQMHSQQPPDATRKNIDPEPVAQTSTVLLNTKAS